VEQKNTEDKADNIETILDELPKLLVKQAYKKLKSGEDYISCISE
jgi:hypothetical protein